MVECVDLAKRAFENGQKFRGHALVWHNQQPSWMHALEGTDTYDNLYDTWDNIMKTHIETVMSAIIEQSGFDSIYAWDVVNEATVYNSGASAWMLHAADDGTGHEHSWYSRMNDYIDKAFTYAHAADPDSKLFYNDFAMEKYSGKHNAVKDLV